MTKICTKCNVKKDISEFGKHNKSKDGLNWWCKHCRKQYNKTHKEELKQNAKKYNDAHKEEIKKYNKQYKENHKKEIKEQQRQYNQTHKEERRKSNKQYRENHKEMARKAHLKWKYNLTIKQFDVMLKQQNNKCFICKKEFNKNKKEPYVDHNHKTNTIRKLLCHSCNSMLGHSFEDISILQAAIDYLKEHNET